MTVPTNTPRGSYGPKGDTPPVVSWLGVAAAPPAIPKLYWDAYSDEQRIKALWACFNGLANRVNQLGYYYLPDFQGEWDRTKEYPPLSVVEAPEGIEGVTAGDSYTALDWVPVGTPLTDTTYWALTGNYNAQISDMKQIIENVSSEVSKIKNTSKYNSVSNYIKLSENTDITNAVQQCVNDCAENGLICLIPSGEYVISSQIEVPRNVSIEGSGNVLGGSTNSNENSTVLDVSAPILNLFNLNGFNSISNVVFRYKNQHFNTGSNYVDNGITLNFLNSGRVRNCKFIGSSTAISFSNDSEYSLIDTVYLTPNPFRPAVVINNGFDIVRISNVHANINLAWEYDEGIELNHVPNINSATLFDVSSVDGVYFNNIFAYGIHTMFNFNNCSNGSSIVTAYADQCENIATFNGDTGNGTIPFNFTNIGHVCTGNDISAPSSFTFNQSNGYKTIIAVSNYKLATGSNAVSNGIIAKSNNANANSILLINNTVTSGTTSEPYDMKANDTLSVENFIFGSTSENSSAVISSKFNNVKYLQKSSFDSPSIIIYKEIQINSGVSDYDEVIDLSDYYLESAPTVQATVYSNASGAIPVFSCSSNSASQATIHVHFLTSPNTATLGINIMIN